jgi:hypothetical protein
MDGLQTLPWAEVDWFAGAPTPAMVPVKQEDGMVYIGLVKDQLDGEHERDMSD